MRCWIFISFHLLSLNFSIKSSSGPIFSLLFAALRGTRLFFPHFFPHMGPSPLGPVVQKWVKFNPGLGEILSNIISSKNTSSLSKIILKYTPWKPDYANPKCQPKSMIEEVNQTVG